MKQQWNTAFRLSLCAMALTGSALVSAQTTPAPQPSGTPMHPASKSAGKYATPQQHEAAAVAGERSKGTGPANPPGAREPSTLERNALRRCEVFKTDDDRRACVERVRQPQISGSVQGGGVIREYTQTVQVPPRPAAQPAAPAPYSAPAPMPMPTPAPHSMQPVPQTAPAAPYQAPSMAPQPRMVPPPVEPMRQ